MSGTVMCLMNLSVKTGNILTRGSMNVKKQVEKALYKFYIQVHALP